MRKLIWLIFAGVLGAQETAPLHLEDAVKDKNFYLLSLMERSTEVRAAVLGDAALAAVARGKREALRGVRGECKAVAACYAEKLALTAAEVNAIAERLRVVALGVDGPLRRSGVAVRYHELGAADLVEKVWREAATNLGRIVGIYVRGEKPRYPAIDSGIYDMKEARMGSYVERMVEWMTAEEASFGMPWSVALHFTTEVMRAQHRDEAGRYEPMEFGENRAAVERMSTIRWEDYAYSVILVPGSGGDRPGIPLSPYGRLRCQIAARRYEQKLAPFVIVSGGHVHPDMTPYAEAIEMKRVLMRDFHVPENAILIEPHARHTTTNVRNGARLIWRYGMPFGKKALITTDGSQSAYIEAKGFGERCVKELGYLPYGGLRRVNAFDLEWVPKVEALQMDAVEMLDP